MKKTLIILLTLTLTASLFVGCGANKDKLNSLESVKKSGKLNRFRRFLSTNGV